MAIRPMAGLVGRGVATSAVILPLIAIFLLHGLLVRIANRDPIHRKRRLVKNVQFYSRMALSVMRIRRSSNANRFPELSQQNHLIVCNHMSYLDMMVLASFFPAVFITSVDMGQVFFLGTMAEVGGSIFVERRNRDRLSHDISQIEKALADGFHVFLFPEGTSGDGRTVLPFKRSLLAAAANAGCPILPVTLKYKSVEGKAFGPSNNDVVCWYGAKDFVTHFARLLAASSVDAEVRVHEPLRFAAADNVHSVGDLLHKTISDEYESLFDPLQGGSNGWSRDSEKFIANIPRSPRKEAGLTANS